MRRRRSPGRTLPERAPCFALHPAYPADEDQIATNVRQPWEPWLRAARAEASELQFGAQFDDAGLVLQAAAEGQGVALARGLLVEDDLRTGRLVRLFETVVEDDYGYSLVQPPSLERAKRDAVEALESWLCSALSGKANS